MCIRFACANCKEWRGAFFLALWGPPSIINKWKQSIVMASGIWTVAAPFLFWPGSLEYRGATPPAVPLIKTTGKVVFESERRGLKYASITNLVTRDGQSIRLQGDFTSLSEIKEWTDIHPTETIYVEGFRLRDGKGLFWISYATTLDGRVLAGREKQQRSLKIRSEVFGPALLWFYTYLVAPTWLFSFIFIRKIRNSISCKQ